MNRSISRRSTLALPFAAASAPWGVMVSGFRLVDLGTLGGPTSHAVAVNASGVIVGSAHTKTLQQRPCLWSHGHVVDLRPLGFDYGSAVDVNDHGDVVLVGGSMAGGQRSYVWSNGLRTALPSAFLPHAIDNRRRVVGTLHHGTADDVPAIWYRGTLTPLTRYGITPGGQVGNVTIDDAGRIAGTDRVGAYVLTGLSGQPEPVGRRLRRAPAAAPGSGLRFTDASGINARGDVAGIATDAAGRQTPALWTSSGAVVDLGTLATPPDAARSSGSGARAVNSARQVVGACVTDDYPDGHPFLWSRGRMIDLGVLSPETGGSSASDINDHGLVVGWSVARMAVGIDDDNIRAVAWVPGAA